VTNAATQSACITTTTAITAGIATQTIRAIIAYFQKKAKATGNKIAQYALCCCQCCFWCLEKCMKFLNKNAYIQTALFSTSFCKSSREAFYLIARNIARVGAVGVISEFVIMIMKLVICLATMGATYLGMREKVCVSSYSVCSYIYRYFHKSYIGGSYGDGSYCRCCCEQRLMRAVRCAVAHVDM
jgi:Plasma-membrane choline transporter